MGIGILHVIESIAPRAGSAAIPLRALANAQGALGASYAIVTADERTGGSDGCSSHVLDPTSLEAGIQDAGLLHIHGWGYDLARRAAKAARRLDVPYVISPYGALTQGPYRRVTIRDRLRYAVSDSGLIRAALRVEAINEFEARSIRDRESRVAVEVTPPGIAFEEYSKCTQATGAREEPGNEQTLLVLGPINPVYGIVPLLKALAECGPLADGWRVVLAGSDEGNWRKQIEAAVQRKGGGDRISFLRADDLDTQREWLAQADAICCVALHPVCPASVLQGLASGLPLLVTSIIALDGLDDQAVVCEPSRAGIREGLRTLMEMDTDARRAVGTRARETARDRYDVRRVVQRFADESKSLCTAEGGQAARP